MSDEQSVGRTEQARDTANNVGTRGLIWAAVRSCPCNDDEEVGESTERSHTKHNQPNGGVDPPQVLGEGASQQQQCSLQHQRERFQHVVEIPRHDPVQLSLTILAAFDGRPSHVDRSVSVQPLLPEHCEESGEERGGKAGVQDALNLDRRSWRAGPLWQSGDIATEGGIVDLVDQDTKEGGGFFVWIRLELGVDLDDECRRHGREQTSLSFASAFIR